MVSGVKVSLILNLDYVSFHAGFITKLFSFDSGPCMACLVGMRDDMLLLHNWDNNYLFCS